VAGSGGYGFIAKADEMISRMKAGKAFMTLDPGEEPLAPARIVEGFDHVAVLSSNGKMLIFPFAEMREMAKGRGIILMRPDAGERLIAVDLATSRQVALRGVNRSGKHMVVTIDGGDLEKFKLHRGRKGARITQRIKPAGFVRQSGAPTA
jgi:topoisomerase-4 subunit A